MGCIPVWTPSQLHTAMGLLWSWKIDPNATKGRRDRTGNGGTAVKVGALAKEWLQSLDSPEEEDRGVSTESPALGSSTGQKSTSVVPHVSSPRNSPRTVPLTSSDVWKQSQALSTVIRAGAFSCSEMLRLFTVQCCTLRKQRQIVKKAMFSCLFCSSGRPHAIPVFTT